ncbi:hypothetical protein E2C01_079785 [Portunus trituberculatus]|uniref:Uncharacterized protein n=1 Tax=Portunus trituberculatus TaxID=210409 RepID=A0A5B7IU91_PORTR|nr:hypothetical protein [Portunus trituberculatus]
MLTANSWTGDEDVAGNRHPIGPAVEGCTKYGKEKDILLFFHSRAEAEAELQSSYVSNKSSELRNIFGLESGSRSEERKGGWGFCRLWRQSGAPGCQGEIKGGGCLGVRRNRERVGHLREREDTFLDAGPR